MEKRVRKAILYKNYFIDFYSALDFKDRSKVDWTIKLIEQHEHVPQEYFKKLVGSDDIWEIRVRRGSNAYRIFCFFDNDRIIILENGFHKKSQKTPRQLIAKAERIKQQYFDEKE